MHHVTDAEWSVVVRRQLENLAMLLPLMAVFFIPILLFRHHLYEWTNVAPGHDPVLDSKRAYLNWNFFLVRSLFYFVFFTTAAFLFRRFSVAQDRDGNPAYTLKMRKLAFTSLPLFGASLTFGAYDWLLGIDYHWFSTMWGVYIFAGAAGSSMSLLVLVITALRKAGGGMDALVHRVLGLQRFQPIHAHLVREHAGRDGIFYPTKHGILECAQPVPRRRALLRSVRDPAFARTEKESAPSLSDRRLDRFHATRRHLHRDLARAPRRRRARKYLGFHAADRHGRHARIFLPADCRQDLALPGSRSARSRISSHN